MGHDRASLASPAFVVEQYVTDGPLESAERLARSGPARWVGSIFVPEDELCLHVLRGPSLETVHRAVEAAAIPCERVVAALDLSPRR
jgi:hypothetical protein